MSQGFDKLSRYLENIIFIGIKYPKNHEVAFNSIMSLSSDFHDVGSLFERMSEQELYHLLWLLYNVRKVFPDKDFNLWNYDVYEEIKTGILHGVRTRTNHEFVVHPILFDRCLGIALNEYYSNIGNIDITKKDPTHFNGDDIVDEYGDDGENAQNIMQQPVITDESEEKKVLGFLNNYLTQEHRIDLSIDDFYAKVPEKISLIRKQVAQEFLDHFVLLFSGCFSRNRFEKTMFSIIDALRIEMGETSKRELMQGEEKVDEQFSAETDFTKFYNEALISDKPPSFPVRRFYMIPRCDFNSHVDSSIFIPLAVSMEGWIYSFLFVYPVINEKEEYRWATYLDQVVLVKTALTHPDNFVLNVNILCGRMLPEKVVGADVPLLETDSMSLLREKTIDLIAAAIDLKRFVQATEIACRKCKKKAVIRQEKQTRSADEAATLIYTCSACGFTWKEN